MNLSKRYHHLISTYIQAKDSNRPWFMTQAFSSDAILKMKVDTDNIDFPSEVLGLEAITETLVRNFACNNENVFTFCLQDTVKIQDERLDCDWVVFMTNKDTGEVRVGWGQYYWRFTSGDSCLVDKLVIKIQQMDILPPSHQEGIFSMIGNYPYPWINSEVLLSGLRPVEYFDDLRLFLATPS